VVRQSAEDKVAVIAAGITLHEALKAYDQLKGAGIPVRVIDAYSVKPIDAKTLLAAARDTGGRLVVVEDHWFEGGLGDAVLDAFAGGEGAAAEQGAKVIKLAVRAMPGSGKPEELMDAAGISASHIVAAVKQALG
jgi:transketolase